MVGCRRVLAREDCVVEIGGGTRELAAIVLGPGRRADEIERLRSIEPPAVPLGRAPLRIVGKPAACARIMRARRAMRRFERGGDVGAGAEAGIDQSALTQPLQRGLVFARALRLD